jgi:hypothetical protein
MPPDAKAFVRRQDDHLAAPANLRVTEAPPRMTSTDFASTMTDTAAREATV